MVKIVLLSATSAALAVSLVTAATPGQCKATKDCAVWGQGYTCVSVQSSILGLTMTSQCVLGSACGGNIPGKCPTFGSWSGNYPKIQPVCAFAPAENCVATSAPASDAESINPVATPNPATVNCYAATFTANNESVTVQGIYKCLDSTIYTGQNLGGLRNLTDTQMQACNGTVTDSIPNPSLCNGHGTCAPVGSLASTYQCVCNQGYSTDDNCLKATSNICDSFGSCGQGNSCDPGTGLCVCSEGTTGPQCSLCDSSPRACSSNGVCTSEGKCKCNVGYLGTFCDKVSPSTASPSGNENGNGTGNAASATVSAAVLIVGLLTWIL
ncbi:hypothetical protein DYB28_001859 [Aphanomyces astaci]|uniref:EGF-like domain-containing protein n=1 Tax=Aphanomyces astaci TaxID=112090 RepID=A0A3L6V9N2_APHAT|nr:hypothetical protein AaE_004989 [Aphanomyces astaci]RLO05437.1 hypothetical protein DYB28_001859 [Aphanomyces astaci]